MSRAIYAVWVLPFLFALTTLAFIVAVFVFGYHAALTAGPQDEAFNAACLSVIGAIVAAGLTAAASLFATVVTDEAS